MDFDDDDTDESCLLHIDAGHRWAQATPVVSRGGAPIGMLNTHWRASQHRPTERQLRFLDLLARQAALLIEQQRAREEMRAHEERLRAMAENLPGGAVFIVGRDLRYQLAAGEAFVAAGYKPEQFLGHTIAEAVGPELAAIYEPNYRRALEGHSFTDTHRAHGREFQTRGVPLRDAAGAVVAVLAVSFDITERRSAEEALAATQTLLEDRVRERTGEVQTVFQRLISAQEEERRRIARDIHDQLGQQMTALRMNIEALSLKSNGDPALLAQAERTQRLAEELDQSITFLTWELRPAELDLAGLSAALRKLVTSWSERFHIAAEFDVSGRDGRLPPTVETNIYRLVQEALHNVLKHAAATHVTVFMTHTDREVTLVVEDNGRGFDPSQRPHSGLGLVSMRERAALVGGRLDIESRAGVGTAIFVRIPIAAGGSNGE